MVSTSKGDIKIWNVKKSKILKIAIAHTQAATKKEYAAIV
jgi:hypothetical protein